MLLPYSIQSDLGDAPRGGGLGQVGREFFLAQILAVGPSGLGQNCLVVGQGVLGAQANQIIPRHRDAVKP